MPASGSANGVVQPAAIDAAVADGDAPTGFHPQGAGELGVAAEQPEIPPAAALLHHAAQVGIQRLKGIAITDAFAGSFQAVYRSPNGGSFIAIELLAWLLVALVSICSCGLGALLAVPGLGPWSVDIYYLMALRRPDVWPRGDLALAAAMHEVKGLKALPSKAEQERIACDWAPYRSIAARLLWMHYLDARGR